MRTQNAIVRGGESSVKRAVTHVVKADLVFNRCAAHHVHLHHVHVNDVYTKTIHAQYIIMVCQGTH